MIKSNKAASPFKMYKHAHGYRPKRKIDRWSRLSEGNIKWHIWMSYKQHPKKGWKGMSRQGSFKSPLQPKWVVLLLWVTVQSPGIRTEGFFFFLRRTGSPDATFTIPGHTSTELDSCYTDFI